MGFVDSLRMQRIFPGDHIPLGWQGKVPAYGGKDPFDDVVGRVQNLRQQNPQFEQIADAVQQQPRQQQQQAQPARVQVPGIMTEYQQAQIAQREADRASREANQQANRGLTEQRIGLAKWKAENPNHIPKEGENGEIIMVNPQNGSVIRTGITSINNLSDAEREEVITNRQRGLESLRAGNRQLLQEDAQEFTAGQNQLNREAQNWGNSAVPMFDKDGKPMGMFQISRTGEVRKVSDEMTRTTPAGTMALQPSQQENAFFNNLRRVVAEHPDWETFIDPVTGAVAPVQTGWFGKFGGNRLTPEIREQIRQALYPPNAPWNQFGVVNPPAETPTAPPAQGTTPAQTTPPPAQTGGNVTPGKPLEPMAPVRSQRNSATIQDQEQFFGRMGGNHPQPAPPVQQRVPGRVYILNNGQPAKWSGSAWIPQ